MSALRKTFKSRASCDLEAGQGAGPAPQPFIAVETPELGFTDVKFADVGQAWQRSRGYDRGNEKY